MAHANWGPKVMRRGELLRVELYGCVARCHATVMRAICYATHPRDEVRGGPRGSPREVRGWQRHEGVQRAGGGS